MRDTAAARAHWRPGSLHGADSVAEAIASRDLTHLYRTSCYFTDQNRYRAFCAMYAVMRVVDDRVDAVRAEPGSANESRAHELSVVNAWNRIVNSSLAGHPPLLCELTAVEHQHAGDLADGLLRSAHLFPVPAGLWRNFFVAMRRDLTQYPFGRFDDFIEYALGAAVSPTTIYLYLLAGKRKRNDSVYRAPRGLDLILCGRELGCFAYLAHILRDLRTDLAAGRNGGTGYLAVEDMVNHGVSKARLMADLKSQHASPPVRSLVRELAQRAWSHNARGRAHMKAVMGVLDPDGQFILELIVKTYEAVLEKLATASYDPISDSLCLTERDKMQLALQAASLADAGVDFVG